MLLQLVGKICLGLLPVTAEGKKQMPSFLVSVKPQVHLLAAVLLLALHMKAWLRYCRIVLLKSGSWGMAGYHNVAEPGFALELVTDHSRRCLPGLELLCTLRVSRERRVTAVVDLAAIVAAEHQEAGLSQGLSTCEP